MEGSSCEPRLASDNTDPRGRSAEDPRNHKICLCLLLLIGCLLGSVTEIASGGTQVTCNSSYKWYLLDRYRFKLYVVLDLTQLHKSPKVHQCQLLPIRPLQTFVVGQVSGSISVRPAELIGPKQNSLAMGREDSAQEYCEEFCGDFFKSLSSAV